MAHQEDQNVEFFGSELQLLFTQGDGSATDIDPKSPDSITSRKGRSCSVAPLMNLRCEILLRMCPKPEAIKFPLLQLSVFGTALNINNPIQLVPASRNIVRSPLPCSVLTTIPAASIALQQPTDSSRVLAPAPILDCSQGWCSRNQARAPGDSDGRVLPGIRGILLEWTLNLPPTTIEYEGPQN